MTRIASIASAIAIIGTLIGANSYSIGDVDPRALRGVWRLTSLDEDGLPFERRRHQQQQLQEQQQTNLDMDPVALWKLRGFLPMKEFTTYPKKKMAGSNAGNADNADSSVSSVSSSPAFVANKSELTSKKKKPTEIFLKLKDDHTFEQCASLRFTDGNEHDNNDAPKSTNLEEKLAMEITKRDKQSFAWKGTWDFLDGKLILATDRPEKKRRPTALAPYLPGEDGYGNERGEDGEDGEDGQYAAEDADTILVGRVLVSSEDSLVDNPALKNKLINEGGDNEQGGKDTLIDPSSATPSSSQSISSNPNQANQSNEPPSYLDIHLSVPRGTIKTGKFMYPKHHPSFFETPIVHPQPQGKFQLRQILGEYNAKLHQNEEELVELYKKEDLVGKKFYLTTFPLKKRQRKGRERWSSQQNKWVQDVYEPSEEEKRKNEEEEQQPGKNMQVVAVELFANNTFATLYGLGSSTILRGKWSIVGNERDRLWMQIFRFGFGRSVSGSTYSEGMSLTQNDEKAYWGKITTINATSSSNVTDASSSTSTSGTIEDNTQEVPSPSNPSKKIEIQGAVMLGWGLEPDSVGRFKMMEMEEEDALFYQERERMEGEDGQDGQDGDGEEEDEDEIDGEYVIEDVSTGHDDLLGGITIEEIVEAEGVDPFDTPGAFE